MTRGEWLSQCEDELKKLRPHLSSKITTTLALQLTRERASASRGARVPRQDDTKARAGRQAQEVMHRAARSGRYDSSSARISVSRASTATLNTMATIVIARVRCCIPGL